MVHNVWIPAVAGICNKSDLFHGNHMSLTQYNSCFMVIIHFTGCNGKTFQNFKCSL